MVLRPLGLGFYPGPQPWLCLPSLSLSFPSIPMILPTLRGSTWLRDPQGLVQMGGRAVRV